MIQLKSYDEIQRIKDSASILVKTHKLLEGMIGEGISTGELNKAAHDLITRNKAVPTFLNYFGYPASICISINHEIIHGIPGKYRLRNGDIVSIDIGVTYKGFISDSAATWPVGKTSDDAQRLLQVTRECLKKGVEQAVFGNRVRDISSAVYRHADAHNFGVVREYCGHGVGFELHEDPQVPNYIFRGANPRLKEGMVLAIEPMINIGSGAINILDDEWTVVTADSSLSAHFEHTVAIFEDRTEVLTKLDT